MLTVLLIITMLAKMEGRRRGGREHDGTAYPHEGATQGIVKDSSHVCSPYGVAKSWTHLSDWIRLQLTCDLQQDYKKPHVHSLHEETYISSWRGQSSSPWPSWMVLITHFILPAETYCHEQGEDKWTFHWISLGETWTGEGSVTNSNSLLPSKEWNLAFTDIVSPWILWEADTGAEHMQRQISGGRKIPWEKRAGGRPPLSSLLKIPWPLRVSWHRSQAAMIPQASGCWIQLCCSPDHWWGAAPQEVRPQLRSKANFRAQQPGSPANGTVLSRSYVCEG